MKLNFYSEKKLWYEIKIFIKHCFSETRLYQSELVTKNSWVTKGNRGEWSEHKGSLGRRNSPMWVGAHKQIHFKSCKVFQDTFLLFFLFHTKDLVLTKFQSYLFELPVDKLDFLF